MLSGEKLVDDLKRKIALLQRFPLATGGDMEGAGLSAASAYQRMPWIVVKGISDWADGTKRDRYQPLAAAAAASLAHHVLSRPSALDGFRKPDG
jgi:nucleoside phosphorylase